MFDVNIVIGSGNNSAISTSKIMKIAAIRKNHDENGNRAEFLGRIRIQMEIFILCFRLFSLILRLLRL